MNKLINKEEYCYPGGFKMVLKDLKYVLKGIGSAFLLEVFGSFLWKEHRSRLVLHKVFYQVVFEGGINGLTSSLYRTYLGTEKYMNKQGYEWIGTNDLLWKKKDIKDE